MRRTAAQDETHDGTQATAQDRVTIQEAAARLGVKDDAIRKRIQRGTLRSEKGGDGRVHVYLDATQDASRDVGEDTTRDSERERGELFEVMRDEIAHLRGQLEGEREARRRADTIIAQLSQTAAEQARTIRAIDPAQDAEDSAGGVEVHEAGEGAQTATGEPRRSFWSRLFGGAGD